MSFYRGRKGGKEMRGLSEELRSIRVMAGLDPRVSGSIFMDRVHDVDSSVF